MEKWNGNTIKEFLSIYKNFELLWDIRNKDYKNNAKRESEMRALLVQLQEKGVYIYKCERIKKENKNDQNGVPTGAEKN